MKPEPFAWAYQNANTEHQYLVWHKQTGGRNWMPLFTLTDVQEAILAEREACAKAAQSAWQTFHDTKRSHERNSMEPFKMERFGFKPELIQQSLIIADAIRARSNT